MPAMGSIGVSGNDSGSYVFAPVQGSNGALPAIWVDTSVTSLALQPEIRLAMSDIRNGKVRSERLTFTRPHIVTDSTTGVQSAHCLLRIKMSIEFERDAPLAFVGNGITQFSQALVSSGILPFLVSGRNATLS